MDKKRALAAAALLATTLTASSYAEVDPDFHIYLAFGQSNMEGQGIIGEQDRSINSRFRVLWTANNGTCTNRTTGRWANATPPLASCYGKLGPMDYFGRTMTDSLPENIKIGVVVVAVAGSDIQLFEKSNYSSYVASAPSWMTPIIDTYGKNPYGRLIDMAQEAQKVGVIKGILLHQGETNSGQTSWPSRVKGVYDNIVDDLGLDASKVPLVAGEVHPNGSCRGMNNIIANLPKESSNFYVVSAQGITGMLQDGQNVHFDAEGYRELGKRFAATMMAAQRAISTSKNVVDSNNTEAVQQSLNSPENRESTAFKVYSSLGKEVLNIGANTSFLEASRICAQSLPAGRYIINMRFNGIDRISTINVK